MEKQLFDKLNVEYTNYSDKEVEWLIHHIGDPNSNIRDNLVCETFGKGFLCENFSHNQARYLIKYVLNRNLLFYNLEKTDSAILTRSFTCLLLELIIETDGDKNSKFYNILYEKERKNIFLNLLDYLKQEHDFTSYSTDWGWVDAVSHLSDTFEVCFKHHSFPKEYGQTFLNNLMLLLLKNSNRFISGEEWRISNALFAGLKYKIFSSSDLCVWLDELKLDDRSDLIAFYQFANLKSILLDLYIKLDNAKLLEKSLKQAIVSNYLKKY
ncbi:hypothetical protein J2Z60_000913 [Lactobacillus colini]|uniref:DUF2785 domain-containing protein n=1 Tax=Lactobacillus colini TaxID=1819254 RepID=A0ABS4MDH8_9LACO|nr:DUF2785 domain-containing protein [Lactobacillus colini]MBP2057741.1 hypothetical protein [Lactobacillus colini]